MANIHTFYFTSVLAYWFRTAETLLTILSAGSQQGLNERRLLNHLFNVSGYNKLERPVRVEIDPLVVTLSVVLQQIIDVVGLQHSTHFVGPWLTCMWLYDNIHTLIRTRHIKYYAHVVSKNWTLLHFQITLTNLAQYNIIWMNLGTKNLHLMLIYFICCFETYIKTQNQRSFKLLNFLNLFFNTNSTPCSDCP